MSQKISTLQITSPILITSTSMNVLNNSLITNDYINNNNNNSVNNICDSLNQSSLLKQKSFSFLMSKQLVRRTIPNSSSLSTSISPSNNLSNRASTTSQIKRQSSTASTMSGANFTKTKSSP